MELTEVSLNEEKNILKGIVKFGNIDVNEIMRSRDRSMRRKNERERPREKGHRIAKSGLHCASQNVQRVDGKIEGAAMARARFYVY